MGYDAQKMKLVKYGVALIAGAAIAALVISWYMPPVMHASRGEVGGTSSSWSFEAFETINQEIPEIVKDREIFMAVVPSSMGYDVIASDGRLRARFGFASLEEPLRRIDARMESLKNGVHSAEPAETDVEEP